ncbi:MAG: carboxymuconolactone decarboxylase family protein [Saprospiraceae bacterium]|nr:carboxymuconolactone decarboxylase family protein [Saprospiraceae bacterium]
MPFFKHLDDYSDITDITFNDRKRLGPLDKVAQRIMRGQSPLSAAEKEIMAAFVSGLNACQFCYGSHAAVAAQFGVEGDIIEQLLEDIDQAPIKEKLKPLFHYLKKLTLTPSKIVQKDVDKVWAAGWTEEALYHTILIACLFNFYNRLLDGHGVKGNSFIYQLGGAHLSKNGYGVPWFISLIKKPLREDKLKRLAKLKGKVT